MDKFLNIAKKFGACILLLVVAGAAIISLIAVIKTGIIPAIIGDAIIIVAAFPTVAKFFKMVFPEVN